MMEELRDNAEEFLESGEDNVIKERYNAAVSDYFKAIVTFADYILYKEMKIMPKNHNERFYLLDKYFGNISSNIRKFFKKYRDSYNLRLSRDDALALKKYAYEIRDIAKSKR